MSAELVEGIAGEEDLVSCLVLSGEDARQTARLLLVVRQFRRPGSCPGIGPGTCRARCRIFCHRIQPGPGKWFLSLFLTGRPYRHQLEAGPTRQAVPSIRRPGPPTRWTGLAVDTLLRFRSHATVLVRSLHSLTDSGDRPTPGNRSAKRLPYSTTEPDFRELDPALSSVPVRPNIVHLANRKSPTWPMRRGGF